MNQSDRDEIKSVLKNLFIGREDKAVKILMKLAEKPLGGGRVVNNKTEEEPEDEGRSFPGSHFGKSM